MTALRPTPTAEIATSGIWVVYEDKTTSRVFPNDRITLTDLLQSRVMEAHPSTVIVSRAAFDRIGFVDEYIPGSYAEDYEWLLRGARETGILAIQEPLVNVHWHQSSFFTARWKMIVDALDLPAREGPRVRAGAGRPGPHHRPDRPGPRRLRRAGPGPPLGPADDAAQLEGAPGLRGHGRLRPAGEGRDRPEAGPRLRERPVTGCSPCWSGIAPVLEFRGSCLDRRSSDVRDRGHPPAAHHPRPSETRQAALRVAALRRVRAVPALVRARVRRR